MGGDTQKIAKRRDGRLKNIGACQILPYKLVDLQFGRAKGLN